MILNSLCPAGPRHTRWLSPNKRCLGSTFPPHTWRRKLRTGSDSRHSSVPRLSLCLAVSLLVFMYVCVVPRLSCVCLPVCMYVWVYLSVCVSVCQPTYFFILFTYVYRKNAVSISQSINLSFIIIYIISSLSNPPSFTYQFIYPLTYIIDVTILQSFKISSYAYLTTNLNISIN